MKQMFQNFSPCSYNITAALGLNGETRITIKKTLSVISVLMLLAPVVAAQNNFFQLQTGSNTQWYLAVGETLSYSGTVNPLSNITLIIENSAGFTLRAETNASQTGSYEVNLQVPEYFMPGRYTVRLYIDGVQVKQENAVVSRMKLETVYQNLLQITEAWEQGIRVYLRQRGEAIPHRLRNMFQAATEARNRAKELWEENRRPEAVIKLTQALREMQMVLRGAQVVNKLQIKPPPEPVQNKLETVRAAELLNKLNQTLLRLEDTGVDSPELERKLESLKALMDESGDLIEQGRYLESNQKIAQVKEEYLEVLTVLKTAALPVQAQLKENYAENIINRIQALEAEIRQINPGLSPKEKLQALNALNILTDAEEEIKILKTRIESGEDVPVTEIEKARKQVDDALSKFDSPSIRERLEKLGAGTPGPAKEQEPQSSSPAKQSQEPATENKPSLEETKETETRRATRQPLI